MRLSVLLVLCALVSLSLGQQVSTSKNIARDDLVQRVEALRLAHMGAIQDIRKSGEEISKIMKEIRDGTCSKPGYGGDKNFCTSSSGSPVCVPKALGSFSDVTGLQCISEATRRGAAFYRHKNGTCQLIGKCTGFVPNKCCCQWKPLESRKEYLLLRIRAYSNDMPYTIWKGSETSMCGNVRVGSTNSYKSPLFLIEREIPFSKVRMDFLTGGERQASLTFKVSTPSGSLKDEGVWLTKRNIIDAYPWSMKLIKKYKFYEKFLRLQGCFHSKVTRRFYVSGMHRGCPGDTGFMGVIEMEKVCDWAKSKIGYPVFAFNKNPLRPWNPKNRAEEMRIYGVVGEVDDNLFMRGENCAYC